MNTIRNFCIIAHIDHGKSTLADRFLELTRTVERRKMREQFLDQMDLEREKGITIKMQPVRMLWHPGGPERSEGQDYILNLAVEGAILLVDATKGVQAQTLANLHHARKQNLVILPVVNKIDSPLARVPEVTKEIAELLQIAESDIFHVSAKDGTNVELLLNAVAEEIPAPRGSDSSPLRALIFDSKYDTYKGIIAYVRLFDGTVSRDDQIVLLGTGAEGFVKEVGHFFPQETPVAALRAGEIGYIATGIKLLSPRSQPV
ncbi:MAG: GTP-binding protein [Candidatus Wildermuthbacteria bacterium]|nr:GTP-binding protein [Candidatus Wildermuthbacteria bacterium]